MADVCIDDVRLLAYYSEWKLFSTHTPAPLLVEKSEPTLPPHINFPPSPYCHVFFLFVSLSQMNGRCFPFPTWARARPALVRPTSLALHSPRLNGRRGEGAEMSHQGDSSVTHSQSLARRIALDIRPRFGHKLY